MNAIGIEYDNFNTSISMCAHNHSSVSILSNSSSNKVPFQIVMYKLSNTRNVLKNVNSCELVNYSRIKDIFLVNWLATSGMQTKSYFLSASFQADGLLLEEFLVSRKGDLCCWQCISRLEKIVYLERLKIYFVCLFYFFIF